jgi:alpha-aminoadipate/glutamate carrier protein LysW
MPTCPECDAMIDIDDDELEEGQTIECPECGSELEVVSTDPVELDSLSGDEDEEEDDKDEDVDIDDEEDI